MLNKVNRLIDLSFRYNMFEEWDDYEPQKYHLKLIRFASFDIVFLWYGDNKVAGNFYLNKNITQKLIDKE